MYYPVDFEHYKMYHDVLFKFKCIHIFRMASIMCCMKNKLLKGTFRTRIKGRGVAIIPKNWKD